MNPKEKAFMDEYIINRGNAYQAALKAGYSRSTAKHAYEWLTKTSPNVTESRYLPYKPYLREAIDARLKEIEDAKIANATEVMQYLTSVVRKEARSQVIVIEGVGEGCTKARLMEKPPDEREALDAAKTLAKIFGLEKNNMNVLAEVGVQIVDDIAEDS